MGVATPNLLLLNGQSSSADNETPSTKQLAIDHKQNQALLVCDQASGSDYLAYLARATNDAVRDWDVKGGRLTWRQGLRHLFGFVSEPKDSTITFWDERLHPA